MSLRFHPVAWGIILGTFLSRGVYFMVYPFLAIYLAKVQGLSPVAIGTILAASSLIGTFSSFLGGVWSDRWGRYPVMIGSVAVWCVVYVLFAQAEAAWMFLVLNSLNGFCRNVFEPASRALLADVTPKEQSLSVFSARYYAINCGMAVGPLIGAWLGAAQSTSPFYFTAAVYALYGVFLLVLRARYGASFVQRPTNPVRLREAVRVIATDRFFRLFLLGNLFVATAYSHLETTLGQYFGTNPHLPQGVWLYSVLLMTNAVAILLLQIPVTRLAQRFDPLSCVKVGAVCFALGLLGCGLFTSAAPLVLSLIVFTLGEILCFVVGDVVIDRHAPADLRGTYFGASGLMFIGQSFGPWLGGWLLHELGFDQGPLLFAILTGLALLALPSYILGEKSAIMVGKITQE